ncbi:unnamed protein product [Spirodela intermedia]|uniref:Uncharacterized protein n=1 Tax=Spirodela intermedia TaxID=51605 RepID=A0A7I8J0X5_SPIIN|nr:unnamed protein product [Spirodela intermedia]CAA6663699.1 unnamed protein product [Spirodela intermedia]
MIETKAVESEIFLEKIDKSSTAPAQAFEQSMHGPDMTACTLCSSYEHVEIECPRMKGPFQPILRPQNFQSTQPTHPAQNKATLATNELLKQMLQEQKEQMQELRIEMEKMKMMVGG